MKYSAILILLLTVNLNGFSQISGIWHNSHYSHDLFRIKKIELNGKVKSWEMKTHEGKNRILKFDKNGAIISDNFKGTTQTFIHEIFMGMQLKNGFEKVYDNAISFDSSYVFNARNQLLEINYPNNTIKNTFDNNGNILVHQESTKIKKIRYYDTPNRNPPYYEYIDEKSYVIIYSYKDNLVTEIENYHSDPFQNFRTVYNYNEKNQLIERRYYSENNIHYRYVKDHYLNLFPKNIDSNFSINDIYEDYWGQNEPAIEKWRYNENGRLIENTTHRKHEITYKVIWNYDLKNRLKNEIHYDTYRERISQILDFDKYGNVIKENVIGYVGIEDRISIIKIEYY